MISGRTIVLTLIALNLLALAWWSGAMDPLIDDGREPERVNAQIQPDRLELIGPVSATGASEKPDGQRSESQTGLPALAGAASQVSQAQQSVMLPATEPLIDSANATGAPVVKTAAGGVRDRDTISGISNSGTPELVNAQRAVDVPDAQFPTGDELNAPDGYEKFNTVQTELPLIAAAISGAPASESSSSAEPDLAAQSACIRYSGLSYVAIRQLEDDYLARGASIDMRRLDSGNYIVYTEPLANLQLALRKEQQLRGLGVKDMHIIKVGPYRHAISLGLLRSYDLASIHMSRMRALGVTTMRIGPVNPTGSRYEISLRGPVALIEGEVRKHPNLKKRFGRDC